ncbi:hypothetical protein KKC1_16760 [Calderihabitans maritimus]|uniref:Uncharacterized protein n=1 Tax=Calderihabitans maritimus TaxID=1246530 RepID=A0A1Z5HSM0_9FIRM|nr:hypothetical protein KKC1_16760 [Calderihabitans maritimus]
MKLVEYLNHAFRHDFSSVNRKILTRVLTTGYNDIAKRVILLLHIKLSENLEVY